MERVLVPGYEMSMQDVKSITLKKFSSNCRKLLIHILTRSHMTKFIIVHCCDHYREIVFKSYGIWFPSKRITSNLWFTATKKQHMYEKNNYLNTCMHMTDICKKLRNSAVRTQNK